MMQSFSLGSGDVIVFNLCGQVSCFDKLNTAPVLRVLDEEQAVQHKAVLSYSLTCLFWFDYL